MPKKSYGETVEKRVKRLFEVLLDHVAHCQCEDNDWGVKLALGEEGKLLRVETNLAALVRLAEQKGEKLTKDQVRDAISHYLADYLGILRDERFKQQGSEEWRFSLTLWAKCGDKTTNLTKFSEEWHKRRSEPSKKAVTKPEATAQSSPQPLTTSGLVDTQLPPVRRWQGRREELQELQTALGNDHLRLIEITAAGGYGKTALARKFTDQLTADWPVLWVNFNQPYPLAQFGRWLLEELKQNYDEKWNDGQLIDAISKGLTAKPCLLVLNNLETVLTAPVNLVYQQFLQKWLNTESSSKLLVTSREQLKFPVNLQDYYYSWPLKGLKEADAMRYVTEDHGLTGSDEELAQFVDKMGGHPLLMELVCSLMKDKFGKGVSVTESQNLGLNLFDVEGYHRDTETCVREVITASLARLSKEFRESLTRLSVLRENFDDRLAQGLIPAITEEDLRYLARLSLLQEFPPEYNVKRRQFQFLPLISMVVQDQANPEILRSAHQLALDYYLAHLPVPPWESLEDLKEYLEAFHHAGALGEWQLAYNILNEERGGEGKNKSVDSFLDLQGFYRKQAELYEEIIAGNQREQVCYRNSLNRLGLCYDSLGQYEKAIAYHQQCHDISKEIGYQQGVAISLCGLGNCYDNLGQYEKEIALYQQYHDISEEIGYRRGVANSLCGLGNCYDNLGQYEKAIALYQQYHDISEEIGYRRGVAISLCGLGNCYDNLGQYEKAIAHYQQYHDISEEIGYRQGVANSLCGLGNCYKSLGQYEKAIAHHQQHHDISEEIGDRQGGAISLGNLGNCYDDLGQYEKAIAHHQQHYDISKEIGFRQGVAISLHNIGEALRKLENYSEAESKIQESLVISQDIKYKSLIARSFKALAEIAQKTNRPELALSHCQEALELCQELGIPLVKDCEELLGEIQATLENN
ncbi:tetratricopeptide repeat protein [Microcystis sp. LEGE 00066]|uniref:tetratricopeptide repeat protein n=1 Tax=Microcystis TaxID=1125 RepID=UPI000A118A42|nr:MULTISPECIES: tetratricopeptide repeat protein [Microcystis]MBE9263213.1 tetratricopeptide repeat protein [Microcystis sp. LEGE 00066]TRT99586.1 MAG: tetratricopeptide repeat protein [Microcystis aeruginosa Ma_AC_P_19900807_S300]UGS10906.1 tetratricopeptide repeat protein [Microcystis aeruginosa FACHB-905 = DIANCHI905]WKX62038.1 tetratricopeptide repeat protein [Microcystis aeruginosa PCC 7806]